MSFDDEIVENWNISRNGNTPLYPRRSEINCFLIYIGELCDLTFCREWQWKDPTLSDHRRDADIQDHRIQASRFWRNIKCNCMVLNVSGSKFYFILISPLKVWPWLYICTHSRTVCCVQFFRLKFLISLTLHYRASNFHYV